MKFTPEARRWTVLIGLWTIVGAVLWLMAVQTFIALISADGEWQCPRVYQVLIKQIDRDQQDSLTDTLKVSRNDKELTLTMLKVETAKLEDGDSIWVLDNYYYTSLRPPQFRVTPQRLLVEFPLPLLLLALWGIHRVRKRQAQEAAKPPSQPRVQFKDEFFSRAERFGTQKKDED